MTKRRALHAYYTTLHVASHVAEIHSTTLDVPQTIATLVAIHGHKIVAKATTKEATR